MSPEKIFSVGDMNRVVFGTFITQAQNELKNVPFLLMRANSRYLTEKSIDDVIEHLQQSAHYLRIAKETYINSHHPQVHHSPHHSHPLTHQEAPRIQAHLS